MCWLPAHERLHSLVIPAFDESIKHGWEDKRGREPLEIGLEFKNAVSLKRDSCVIDSLDLVQHGVVQQHSIFTTSANKVVSAKTFIISS